MSVNASSSVERLGRYEILGEIASGGMATVFLGRVTGAKGFQRLVAIKRLHPHLESEEDFVSMFLDEARLAAKIRHQNVVGTLDVEDQEGLYIVMEFIEGDRLLGLLRHAAKTGERIPIPVAIRIALDTLAGLHAAHELPDDDGEFLGLVHRDVSPQNILIGVDGVARLTDFGIAKATSRLTVTRDGQLKGKIAYMAPEQTKRVEIDRRVDIFAMGIITWEMLTSKKLFTGESDVEVLNQLLFEPIPRLKESAPGIPPAIDAAVMKALERDPAKRYATAAEFADALERASKVVGGPANARTVATHLQKVSAEKIAKDRARISSAGTPVPQEGQSMASRVRRTGSFPAVNTGAHAAITLPDEPSRPNTASGAGPVPPALPPQRVGKQTMMGMAPPPLPPPLPTTPTGPAIKATPSNPPMAPPIVAADQTLIDDDEDVPTSAVVRTKEMAEALGVPGRALPSSRTPGTPALPSIPSSTGSVAAVGAPPLPLNRPVSTPPSASAPAAAPSSTTTAANVDLVAPAAIAAPIAAEPSTRNRGLLVGVASLLLLGAVGGAWAILGRTSTRPTASTTTNPSGESAPNATPTIASPTNEANPAIAPTITDAAVAVNPAADAQTHEANTAAAPAADAAVATTDAAVAPSEPTAPENTAAATHSTSHGSHSHTASSATGHAATGTTSTSTTNNAAATNTNSNGNNTAHPSTGSSHPNTGHSNTHEDDPFGTANPYQR